MNYIKLMANKMSADDFKKLYNSWNNLADLIEEEERTLKRRERAAIRMDAWKSRFGPNVRTPDLIDHSPRAEEAYNAHDVLLPQSIAATMVYLKNNLDDALSGDDEKVILGAARGIEHDPRNSEMALYLWAYQRFDLLKEEDPNKQVPRRKRKPRLKRTQRDKLTQSILPVLIKESIRSGNSNLSDIELDEGVKAFLPYALTDREYIPWLMEEGEKWMVNKVKALGTVKDYIKGSLKTDRDYLDFAFSLGEAYLN